MDTPFFPHWRARLAAFGQRAHGLRQKPILHLEKIFAHLLPPALLSQAEAGLNSRDRLYPLRRTFWAFLWQVLNPGSPCREVVRQLQALFCLAGGPPTDEGTSAYCQARARLPLATVQSVRQAAADHAEKLVPERLRLWHGWRPKVVDGSSLGLVDTPANQAAYPQSASQKPGCGFPLLKLVGLFSLSSGALLGCATGNKHLAELPLFFRLRRLLQQGDLLVADRGFASYVVMALLELIGLPKTMRQAVNSLAIKGRAALVGAV